MQKALWDGRTLVWFSCGAASAVAAKLVIERIPDADVLYHDLSESEHPDNYRFFNDVQKWIGVPIHRTHHPKYHNIDEVFEGERFLASVHGAPCTRKLKRDVGDLLMDFNDTNVFGMTADEYVRIKKFEIREPNIKVWWILHELGITKADCFQMLTKAGIDLPMMYKLGYRNNNCIGCVKGGMGYWNKIRRDFPDVFKRRAEQERKFGYPVLRTVYLDELSPDAGRYESEPSLSCGPICVFDALEPQPTI